MFSCFRDRRGRDRVVVEYTTTYVINVSLLTLWIPLVPRCIEYIVCQ